MPFKSAPTGMGSFEFVEQVLKAEADGNRFPFSLEACGKVFGRQWRDQAFRLLKENVAFRENIDFCVRIHNPVTLMERAFAHLPVEYSYAVDQRVGAQVLDVEAVEYWLTSDCFQALCLAFRTSATIKTRVAYATTRRWLETGFNPEFATKDHTKQAT
jgi:hypothetical protein